MISEHLRGRGVRDERVLDAMERVPREKFIPPELRDRAYEDGPLPIGRGQTISQPYVVALMSESLHLSGDEKVLEIGTGSGYQAAVLAKLVAKVYSVEIRPELHARALEDLKSLGVRNVQLRLGDGAEGWPEKAPFDAIILTCAARQEPQRLIEQLRSGGRLCMPIGPDLHAQELVLLHKEPDGRVDSRMVTAVCFVPLVSPADLEHGERGSGHDT